MSKAFYIAAIAGVSIHILASVYTVYSLFDFQLFQKQIVPYLILSTVILLFNSFVIVRYCWHKKYWWALIGFVLSSTLTLIDIIDTYFLFSGKGQLVLKDPEVHWYVSIICTSIHFLLILLSQTRKVRWFKVYALTGLTLSLTLSFVNQSQNPITYTMTLLLYCAIPIFLILIYWNEIKKLNTNESDEILDAS